MNKTIVSILLFAVALTSLAFSPVPKASGKALGVTRGRAFSTGAVFVNGKYIAPPYVVIRWGTGIRINGIPVTGQIVEWNAFLKTQKDVKTIVTEENKAVETAPEPAPEPEPATSVAESDDDDFDSLDELFDDDPTPKKKQSKSGARAVTEKQAVDARPRQTVEYVLEGEFIPNEESKALLKKVNAVRLEIDRQLRAGGFIFFGDNYSRITGDDRTLIKMFETLPKLMQNATTWESFRAGVRSAQLHFLGDVICEDLYRNRTDYRKLLDRQRQLEKSRQWDKMLEDVGDPLF